MNRQIDGSNMPITNVLWEFLDNEGKSDELEINPDRTRSRVVSYCTIDGETYSLIFGVEEDTDLY